MSETETEISTEADRKQFTIDLRVWALMAAIVVVVAAFVATR
jgi:hypothetical protein